MAPVASSLAVLLAAVPAVFGATANLLVSHYTGNIYSLALTTSGTTGSLSIKQTLKAGGTMPSWLTLDSASGTLYVTDETTYNSPVLTTIKVGNDASISSTGTARSPSGGEVHSSLYGGSDGKSYLAAAEYDPSKVSVWKLPLSSSSQPMQSFTFTMNGKGPNPSRQDKPHPHSIIPDPTGKYLLAPDLGADLIRIFSVNSGTGQLTQCTNAQTGGGDGPRHAAFSTDGKTLYVVNELANSLTVWTVTYPSSGCLTLQKTQSLSAYPAGKSAPSGSKSAEVHVAGSFVYLANRGDQSFGSQKDSVVTYSTDASGAATFLEATSAYTWYPRTFQINKAGDLVAFGGQTSSTVAIVARNTTSGRLGPLVTSLQVGSAGSAGNEDGLSAVIWDE